jgi:hypothetical protein
VRMLENLSELMLTCKIPEHISQPPYIQIFPVLCMICNLPTPDHLCGLMVRVPG